LTPAAPEERAVLLDQLRALLIERLRLRVPPQHIDPDAPLFGTGLGLDSVDAVELVVAIKQTFGVQIPNDADARAWMRTPNSLIDAVLTLRARAQ